VVRRKPGVAPYVGDEKRAHLELKVQKARLEEVSNTQNHLDCGERLGADNILATLRDVGLSLTVRPGTW
jgi:hypothetical protein